MWNTLIDRVAEVIHVHLEQEVFEDLHRVVGDLQLDQALLIVLIHTHHCSLHLDSTGLLLAPSLSFW